MQTSLQVALNPLDKAVGLPCLSPEWNGDSLTKMVQLQSTAADGIEDGGIVHQLVPQALLHGPEEEVRVRGRPAGEAVAITG